MVFKHFCSLLLVPLLAAGAWAQSLGNAGTIEGTVTDQTGASVPDAKVTIKNAVSGYSRSATSATDGTFRLTNIPPNPYHLEVMAAGFNDSART